MTLLKYLGRAVLIAVGMLLLIVLRDLLHPYRPIEVKIEPDFIVYPVGDIRNPEEQPFILEVAFNLGIDPSEVTQEQFNDRYLTQK